MTSVCYFDMQNALTVLKRLRYYSCLCETTKLGYQLLGLIVVVGCRGTRNNFSGWLDKTTCWKKVIFDVTIFAYQKFMRIVVHTTKTTICVHHDQFQRVHTLVCLCACGCAILLRFASQMLPLQTSSPNFISMNRSNIHSLNENRTSKWISTQAAFQTYFL
jgi:hypothetical protein